LEYAILFRFRLSGKIQELWSGGACSLVKVDRLA
jgi:hypothetical protein